MINHNHNIVEIIEINQWLINLTNDSNSINYDEYKLNHNTTCFTIVTTLVRS